MSSIVIVGLNHRTAPVEIRERLAFPADTIGHSLRGLVEREEIVEGIILSTCNRVEVCVLAGGESYKGATAVKEFLSATHGIARDELNGYLYHYEGEEAVKHLFRVSSSLDSMVLGEPQILGQVKDAYGYAAEFRTIGPILDKFYTKAFSVAKRVRTETKVASSAVSVSYAAVELAKKIFGNLKDKTAMLIGAGEMCELAARHLLSAGVKRILVTNRTFERAVKLAGEFDGMPVRFDELLSHLKMADIILSSTGAPHFILKKEDVEEVLRIRKNRPMFFIDMAVPRDIDPDANQIDNVYVYDIDDLNNVIETNLEERQKEAARAEEIVSAEVRNFLRWLEAQQVTPTIVMLRRKFEEVKNAEVAKAIAMLGPEDPKTKKVVESLATSILNKVLHPPITALKKDVDGRDVTELVATVRELFDLPENDEPSPPSTEARKEKEGGEIE
ncbi:MAG: glutamyl-tRNA reductase [Deltaproteobacteria bacterium RBG_16_64_85]|nr:MAG: glutamyl-tRNA reductase [Deltaproteobacteria bacterium RBG_16_64_85]